MSDDAAPASGFGVIFAPFRLYPERKLLVEGDKPVRPGSRALAWAFRPGGEPSIGIDLTVAAVPNQKELAGLICESFAFQVPAPNFALAAIKGLSHVAPRLPVLTLHNKDFSRDPKWVDTLDTIR